MTFTLILIFLNIISLITEMENESMASPMSPKEEIDMIRKAFETGDMNKDGVWSREELKAFIQKTGKIKYISMYPPIECCYLQEMFLSSTSPNCSTRLTSTRTGRLILRSLFRS